MTGPDRGPHEESTPATRGSSTTSARAASSGDRTDQPARPPLVAMLVVGLVGLAVLGLFLRSGGLGNQSLTESLLDEDEVVVGPGQVRLELGDATLSAELSEPWIRRERCPGWVQLTSMGGDATRVHVIATPGAPDTATGRLEPVGDYATWLASSQGVGMDAATSTSVLGVPAVAGRLAAGPEAPREALVAACAEVDGSASTGIRGPAAGFDQELVVTSGTVDDLGHVLVLGAAWTGGDIEEAGAEARGMAASLARVED